jgi:hypothetical protein
MLARDGLAIPSPILQRLIERIPKLELRGREFPLTLVAEGSQAEVRDRDQTRHRRAVRGSVLAGRNENQDEAAGRGRPRDRSRTRGTFRREGMAVRRVLTASRASR